MKIVLTYAPSEQQFLPVPPLGISALSRYLSNNGIKSDILDLELELWLNQGNISSEFAAKPTEDLNIDKLPVEGVAKMLKGYDIVAFSLMGKRQIPYVIAIIKKLKVTSSRLKYVIVGGAFFDEKNSRDVIKRWNGLINFVIVGEGWRPMYDLIIHLQQGKEDINDTIPGITYMDRKGHIWVNKTLKWEGVLPLPDYNNINKKGYVIQQKKLYGIDDENIVYHVLVGDRKCPYRCSFCRISDVTKRVKEPSEIADEMIELNKQCGAERFSLVCNEMNPSETYFQEFLDRLLTYEKTLSWFCYLRPNKLSLSTLKKAKKAGCVLIRYGVESGSQKIINNMQKKLYVIEMEKIMKDTHLAGIWNHINIVTGYLYETKEDVTMTVNFLEKNKQFIDSVRVNPFYIPLGSPIHKNPEQYRISLRENTGSHIQFDELDCTWEEKQIRIQKATAKVLEKCIDVDINFAGILPFFVAVVVSHFGDVNKAKEWMKRQHNYLWQPISPDTAKWRLAHPEREEVLINRWEEIAGKRSSNYQTFMEMNTDEEDSY